MTLGIELGSTRIKAVIIAKKGKIVAQSAHDWENKLVDGYWTYSLDDVLNGLADCVAKLPKDALKDVSAMGISAMMHGYLAFDKNNNLLVPFRTWRNTTTEAAADKLTKAFNFNIPQRWSIAHLYQAVLNGEPHVKDIAFVTTLAGYVHWRLTGQKVLGIGDASGMFPIEDGNYNKRFAKIFFDITKIDINNIFPKVLTAGQNAGNLLPDRLLDLPFGIPLCPPEGDAGTGMVATNAVAQRSGNVSAGTSIFAMAVLERPLKNLHIELDMVTTPAGDSVAMAHCNNCTSDIDAWVNLFGEVSGLSRESLYDKIYGAAANGDNDCGGLMSFNYFGGEPITETDSGRPLFMRTPDAAFNMSNFSKNLLYSAVATLKLGMDVLALEGVKLDILLGHGGLFKYPLVGQQIMADALNVPVAVMESAGEGGAWGIALLADYLSHNNVTLQEYLNQIFLDAKSVVTKPSEDGRKGFGQYIEKYQKCLEVERLAARTL